MKSIQDIFMDLCSESCVFLEGLAHKAMLQGARNIITMILDIVLKGSFKYSSVSGMCSAINGMFQIVE